MKNLNARRDELAEEWWAKFNQGNPIVTHARSVYRAGFDAAVAELRPEIEKLVKALETEAQFLSMRGMIPLDKNHHILKTLTNFKEFMGDGE